MEQKNQINVYTCQMNRSHHIITINLDDGVTPFCIGCQYEDHGPDPHERGFIGMNSVFCRVNQNVIPTHCWYRKKESELSEFEKDHHENGGLFLRKLTNDEFVKIALEQHAKYPEMNQ